MSASPPQAPRPAPGAGLGRAGAVARVSLAVTIGVQPPAARDAGGHLGGGAAGLQIPVAAWISAAMDWLVNTASFGLFTFRDLTRWIAAALALPLEAATALFATGLMRGRGRPRCSSCRRCRGSRWRSRRRWSASMPAAGGSRRWSAGASLYLAVFGQWQSAMVTLPSIVVAVPLGVAAGWPSASPAGAAAASSGCWRRSSTPCRRCRSLPTCCRSCACSASGRWRR